MEQAGNGADSDALVFVYGSLKRGMANHGELHGAAELGRARLEGLTLYDLGPFPMAIPSSEPGCAIEGELYQVGYAVLTSPGARETKVIPGQLRKNSSKSSSVCSAKGRV